MSVLGTTKHSSAIVLTLGNKVILCSNNNNSSLLQGHDHTSDIPTGSNNSISLKKNEKIIKPSLLLLEKSKAQKRLI